MAQNAVNRDCPFGVGKSYPWPSAPGRANGVTGIKEQTFDR